MDPSLARRLYEQVLAPVRAAVRDDPELYEFVRLIYEFGYADGPIARTFADLATDSKKRSTFTPAEAGIELRIGAHQIRRLVRTGRLAAEVDDLGHYSISVTAIEDYRASQRR